VDPEGETEFHFTTIRNKDTGKTTTVLKVTPARYIERLSKVDLPFGGYIDKRQVYDVVIKEEIVIENGAVQSKTKTKSEGKLRATTYVDTYYTFYVPLLDLEMPGGLYLVGEGGASPTEYHALSDADLVEVDDLITAFGAMGTGASLGSELADKIKLVTDLTEELASDGDKAKPAVPDANDTICCGNGTLHLRKDSATHSNPITPPAGKTVEDYKGNKK